MCVEWPDIDEQTFARFTQWAYTESYVTAEPDIILDQSSIDFLWPTNDSCETHEDPGDPGDLGKAMYSLQSWKQTVAKNECCSECMTRNTSCYCGRSPAIRTTCCITRLPKKSLLVEKFLDKDNQAYPTTTSIFKPRRNKESCEDYTGVFLCHAKLYVIGDVYDIPKLRQLALHRLHATLRDFTLYPSRLDDIDTLARYVFGNTQPHDKIQDMIGLYYACIIDDAAKHEGLESLIDDVPDFAHALVSKMSERLA